jgi:uncharacterized membrane protein YozB (DUF420 family)
MHLALFIAGVGLTTFGLWAALHDLASDDRRWVPLWLAVAALPALALYLMVMPRWPS